MNAMQDTISNQDSPCDLKAGRTTPAKPPTQIFGRILVGTDFLSGSARVFAQSLKLAKQNRAELLLAHSFVMPNTLSFMPADAYDDWETQRRTEAEQNIGALVQKARREGVKAHMLVLSGFAEDALARAAKRLKVDLIVIGTHAPHTLSRLFARSHSARIMARAPCPVLIVRNSRTAE